MELYSSTMAYTYTWCWTTSWKQEGSPTRATNVWYLSGCMCFLFLAQGAPTNSFASLSVYCTYLLVLPLVVGGWTNYSSSLCCSIYWEASAFPPSEKILVLVTVLVPSVCYPTCPSCCPCYCWTNRTSPDWSSTDISQDFLKALSSMNFASRLTTIFLLLECRFYMPLRSRYILWDTPSSQFDLVCYASRLECGNRPHFRISWDDRFPTSSLWIILRVFSSPIPYDESYYKYILLCCKLLPIDT